MSRKPKFKPEVIRVRLNPEQAVLACGCWSGGFYTGTSKAGDQGTAGCSGDPDRVTHYKGSCTGRGSEVFPDGATKTANS